MDLTASTVTPRIAVLTAVTMGMATLSAVFKADYHDPAFQIVLIQLSGIGFLVAGLLTWISRPEFRTGELMVWVAIALYMEDLQLSHWDVLRTFGLVVANASTPVLAQLVLTYPTGRTTSPVRRALIVGAYVVEVGLQVVRLPFEAPVKAYDEVTNLALVWDLPSFDHAVGTVQNVGIEVLGVAGLGILVAAFVRAPSTSKRVLTPAYGPAFVILVMTLVSYAANIAGIAKGVQHALEWSSEAVYLLWPLGFLIGALSSRTSLSSVARLAGFDGAQLELVGALRQTLHDPDLRLLDPAEGDVAAPGRVLCSIVHQGEQVAVLDHQADLLLEPQLLAAATTVIGVTLYNRTLRLRAERQRDEVRQSRLRIVEAGIDARRQLERDLHDGTQQRLLATIINQRMIIQDLRREGVDVAELETSTDELERTLQDLREIARGVHPALVSERGLAAALEDLLARSPLPVELVAAPLPPLDRTTSTALFFAVSEALTNVVRHADAEKVTVEVGVRNQLLALSVCDDGRGDADPSGEGLRGIADRIQAIGGELVVTSPRGGGTSVVMRVPLARP